MEYHWAKQAQSAHLEVESLSKLCGFADIDDETYDSLGRELGFGNVAKLQRSYSEPVDPTKFNRGDQVTVVKRLTLDLPIWGDQTFRNGIHVGTEWGHRGFHGQHTACCSSRW